MSKRETNKRILQTAEHLFSNKGYEATTTREIAELAKVNEVTIFRHFGSKEGLLTSVILQYSSLSGIEKLEQELTGELYNDLHLIAKRYLENSNLVKDFIRISVMEIPRNPELAQDVAAIPKKLIAHLVDYLNKQADKGKFPKQNFEILAESFYGTLFYFVMNLHAFKINYFIADSRDEFLTSLAKTYTKTIVNP